ncbi:transposase [Streptomyces sp. ISL-10]|uniref:transposase n=1 Tax=Streptomyces sp. ISL-10 TaxID=2819172 RepID=UPI001BE9D526|nr:transposase [Streptomyces sp. ISL-10]MBT2366357.1 transposase [Streptomyces sp. ISL-10]
MRLAQHRHRAPIRRYPRRNIRSRDAGPLNWQGRAWRSAGRPRRLRAIYNRYGGVMHMLAALDLATGKIYYRIRQRKRWREFLGLLNTLRDRWPGEKLYVVLDNFSPHKHAEVRTWAPRRAELCYRRLHPLAQHPR